MCICMIEHALIINYAVCWRVYLENAWTPDGCVWLFNVLEEDPCLGFILNTKGTLSNFRENFVMKGLLRDLSPMHRSQP